MQDNLKKDLADSGGSKNIVLDGPWGRFWKILSEPWTVILLLASVALFVIGQQKLSPSVMALVQILLAVASGVLGARVTNLLESAASKNVLEARGRVAVRGLKLMLVQTAAFQRRVDRFRENRFHIEKHPEVTERNYEEAIEFCRRIQEEAASAMETWADVVPSADLSSLIGRITEAEDNYEATKLELSGARDLLQSAGANSDQTGRLEEVIKVLELKLSDSQMRIAELNNRLSSVQRENSGRMLSEEEKNEFLAAAVAAARRTRPAPKPMHRNRLAELVIGKDVDFDDRK